MEKENNYHPEIEDEKELTKAKEYVDGLDQPPVEKFTDSPDYLPVPKASEVKGPGVHMQEEIIRKLWRRVKRKKPR